MNKIGIYLITLIGSLLKFANTHAVLSNDIDTKVMETIEYSVEIPGLKSEEFSALKSDIIKTWATLLRDGIIEISGTDKEVRPCFVAIQGIVEHVLAFELQESVKTLKGIIHTPMPATPLCSQGEISKELVDPSIELDPARLFTVKARTMIVRDYLFKGGDLYIVYPKSGFDKRNEEQQKIYKQELLNYPDHLFDVPLKCESIPGELVGATYLFQDNAENTFVFSIKMTQAKDPQETGHFGLWFGPVHHAAVLERLHTISDYFQNDVNIRAP